MKLQIRYSNEQALLASQLSLGPPDDYEVSWNQVKLLEVIGQGAFGVVRKATLTLSPENRAKLMQKGAPLPSGRAGSRLGEVQYRETVAIKMLKGRWICLFKPAFVFV
jgi:hypothetical protein